MCKLLNFVSAKKGSTNPTTISNSSTSITETNGLFGNATAEDRNRSNAENLRYMEANFGHIYRSKGFLWLAGRDNQYAEWSQAGVVGELSCGGPWVCMIPEETLGADFEDFRNLIAENFDSGIIGDRRQELVIIGVSKFQFKISTKEGNKIISFSKIGS